MKLNKQGVRDLNGIVNAGAKRFDERPLSRASVAARVELTEGKNHLPAELASKLLANEQAQVAEFGAPLDPEQQEFLQLLAEECAETVQRVTKILRFGLRRNPWNGQDNVERLEAEIGDICAVLDVLELLGIVDSERVHSHTIRKLKAFVTEVDPARPRLRHITPETRNRICRELLGTFPQS